MCTEMCSISRSNLCTIDAKRHVRLAKWSKAIHHEITLTIWPHSGPICPIPGQFWPLLGAHVGRVWSNSGQIWSIPEPRPRHKPALKPLPLRARHRPLRKCDGLPTHRRTRVDAAPAVADRLGRRCFGLGLSLIDATAGQPGVPNRDRFCCCGSLSCGSRRHRFQP